MDVGRHPHGFLVDRLDSTLRSNVSGKALDRRVVDDIKALVEGRVAAPSGLGPELDKEIRSSPAVRHGEPVESVARGAARLYKMEHSSI